MQLTFTPDLCSIFLKDEITYYRLQQIIDKHFPHRVGRKDKIILFPKEDELHQRRYFLKLISKLYQKNQNQKGDEVAKLEGSLGWIINFHFKKEDLSLLEKRLKNKNGRKRRLNSLYGLLEEYFALLGCSAKDSFEKIRKQYLALVKQYHPDMNSCRSKELTSLYREKFENIQIAYEMIKTYYNEQGSICA